MANNKMYWGTADRMTWVSCPSINMGVNSVRWSSVMTYLNGGASQRQSNAARKEYSLSWSPQKKENIAEILSYFDGTYGDGPVYFLDPAAMDFNVLPSWFAAPFILGKDGPTFLPTRPTLTATAPNSLGYPTRSITASVDGSTVYTTVKVPVPSGYTLHVGAHGTASGTVVLNVNGTTAPLLSVTDTQRTNLTLAGGVMAEIKFSGTGTLTLSGVIAQILPTGETVQPGGFVPGFGHSGVAMAGDPQVTEYSAALTNASFGATVNVVEVGAWA